MWQVDFDRCLLAVISSSLSSVYCKSCPLVVDSRPAPQTVGALSPSPAGVRRSKSNTTLRDSLLGRCP
jgi:hypothetical protein